MKTTFASGGMFAEVLMFIGFVVVLGAVVFILFLVANLVRRGFHYGFDLVEAHRKIERLEAELAARNREYVALGEDCRGLRAQLREYASAAEQYMEAVTLVAAQQDAIGEAINEAGRHSEEERLP